MYKTCISVAFSLAILLMAGCGNSSSPQQQTGNETITIVATVGMVADIARNVAGEHASVTNIIGEGIDPHVYRATRQDMIDLKNADLVLYSGLFLEGKMAEVLSSMAEKGKSIAAVAESIPHDNLLASQDNPEHPDPHVWMDVKGWIAATKATCEAISTYDPDHKAEYEANTAAYIAELEKLDAYAKYALASIPEEKRIMITAHDAFNYLGRAYGIDVQGIQGLSTESEAGLGDVNKLVELIVERKIDAIFVETSVSDKNVRALIEGAGARGQKVVIGGSLFSDAMGTKGTYEGTYIGMIDHNVTTIARALGGTAPEKGMQGKLTMEMAK